MELYEFKSFLRERLLEEGASLVGFCRIKDRCEFCPDLSYAVSIVYRLSDSILKTIDGQPSIMYYHHYRTVNQKLDLLALTAVNLIEREGYSAFPVAASQSLNTNKDEYRAVFSHKTAAVLSGLGFIGKSGLFITPQYGSKVRLATVLCDMPLCDEKPVLSSRCGSCTKCKDACPAGAIKGAEYLPGSSRDTIFDAEKCSAHMKTYKHIGRGAVCGLCIKACPFNRLG